MKNNEKKKSLLRKKAFENKKKFHLEQANLPIEEKIKILVKLQEIASHIKKDPNKPVWLLK